MASRDECLQLRPKFRRNIRMVCFQPTVILVDKMHRLSWNRSFTTRHRPHITVPGPRVANFRRVPRQWHLSTKCKPWRQVYLHWTSGRCRCIGSKAWSLQQHLRQKYTYSTRGSTMPLRGSGAINNRSAARQFGFMPVRSNMKYRWRVLKCYRLDNQAIRLTSCETSFFLKKNWLTPQTLFS